MANPTPALLLKSGSTSGLVDNFGRDFKAYLLDNPDEARRFAQGWADTDVAALLTVVEGFFVGLPHFRRK